MSDMTPKPSHQILAWLGLGVGLIGIAFTLRPPTHISPTVFWLVLALGIVSVGIGSVAIFGSDDDSPEPRPDLGTGKKLLLATECDRFSEALSAFVREQWRLRPRWRPFSNYSSRIWRWEEQMKACYRQDFRGWGLEIFDDAVSLGGVAASSRRFVEAPSPTQLSELPDLFRDAANTLKRT